jgi:hypothetical protein
MCFWRKFAPPYSLNTQRGWHTSESKLIFCNLSSTSSPCPESKCRW